MDIIIDYLLKPIKEDIFIEKIKSYLKYSESIEYIKSTTYKQQLVSTFNKASRILDAQTSFVAIISFDGLIIEANKTLLKFFGYKNMKELFNEEDSIANLFIKEDGYLQKEQNGKSWLDIILENIDIEHKIKLLSKDNKEHIFKISTDGKNIEDEDEDEDMFILSFIDITELIDLQNNLEIRVKEEVEKNRTKDLEILEFSKMVSMGEMIGNIAHQWRQPLSAISTLSTSIIAQKEFGIYDDNDLIKDMNKINESSQYLSETINTFRDFLKDKKELKEQVLQDNIKSAISIVGTVLKDVNIDFEDNVDYSNPIKITIVSGELPQVIINIINNAKDIILEKELENGLIKLDLILENEKAIITIEDNGGGVPEKILPKIFDPYFTTKHQSKGTGLGLHMSYRIVTESMNGKLYVRNINDGAKFFIELPLNS